MTPGPDCYALVKRFEGCKLAAYPDPGTGGPPWTVGYGATGPDIHPGTVWTQEMAETRLLQDLQRFGRAVTALLQNSMTRQNQFDALVSFCYNLGAGSLAGSTLLKDHLAGNYPGAAAEFLRWDHAGGHVMGGLTARRRAESELYRRV